MISVVALALTSPNSTNAVVETDSTAAKGIIQRLGASKKTKHFATKKFWAQTLVRSKIIEVRKVPGLENVADLYTRWTDRLCGSFFPRSGLCSSRRLASPSW